MGLNCFWLWVSCSKDLENLEYTFVDFVPMSTMTQAVLPVKVLFIGNFFRKLFVLDKNTWNYIIVL